MPGTQVKDWYACFGQASEEDLHKSDTSQMSLHKHFTSSQVSLFHYIQTFSTLLEAQYNKTRQKKKMWRANMKNEGRGGDLIIILV
jgi:hypothetical protein